MAGAVTSYIQPITEPLQGLHTSFTDLASQHRDINKQLRTHANDLLSGSGMSFQGAGAQAFSGLVNYYVDTSEKHMKTLDSAANAVRTCHSTITTASANADGAGLHPGLTNHVLSQVSHNDIIERGSEPIWAVVNDMMKTIGDMLHQGGSFLGDVFTGNFSGAWDALKKEWGDLGNLGSDAMSLVQDVGRVLGSWADTVWNAIKTCASFIGRILWDVADFVLGISSIINDVKVLFDPHKSLWDKLLAAGDLVLNVGMDVSMFFGVGEALKGGELLLKGGIDLGEKFMENGGVDMVEKGLADLSDKGAEDLGNKGADEVGKAWQQIQSKAQEFAKDPKLQDLQKEVKQLDGVKNWGKLNPEERLNVLQDINKKMADKLGFQPNKVVSKTTEELGGAHGKLFPATREIGINENLLKDAPKKGFFSSIFGNGTKDATRQALDTISHESRHAYQQQLVETFLRDPGSLSNSDRALAQQFHQNWYVPGNYVEPAQGWAKYATQPIELDAWGWGIAFAGGF